MICGFSQAALSWESLSTQNHCQSQIKWCLGRFLKQGICIILQKKVKYTWSHTRSVFSGRQAENERNLFFLRVLGQPATNSMKPTARAATCASLCVLFSQWQDEKKDKTLDQGFHFFKVRSLVNGWWESQKGRLGGQDLCTGFHILLHSRRVLPDKGMACLNRKGPQRSSNPPRTLWGQSANSRGGPWQQ